jgi:hypothetical protein
MYLDATASAAVIAGTYHGSVTERMSATISPERSAPLWKNQAPRQSRTIAMSTSIAAPIAPSKPGAAWRTPASIPARAASRSRMGSNSPFGVRKKCLDLENAIIV